jgi:predicted ATP-dependent endonuclease of OLD family
VPFSISSSGSNYAIQLINYSKYSHRKFNDFFKKLPDSLGIVYASPVATILSNEEFSTDPIIRDKIIQRQSFQVVRNRIYKLLTGSDVTQSSAFVQDLNYILFNNEQSLILDTRSNIQRDKRVLVNFHIGNNDTEKDLALLGSGSLQTIEILLNLYQPGDATRELNLILLDEPDSHIHRDIQARLVNVLRKFGTNKQIFISTHNESLIRNADYEHVFHMSGKNTDDIKPVSTHEVLAIAPRFKGIYPSQINPIMRSIGSATGLDFINAIESDRLIFVEGEDDARVLNLLLKQQIGNRKKYMFWVLGGISEVFENMEAYKKVFSNIRNEKTLWEKSCLVFDRDFLTDAHLQALIDAFKSKLNLHAYSYMAYTLESTFYRHRKTGFFGNQMVSLERSIRR